MFTTDKIKPMKRIMFFFLFTIIFLNDCKSQTINNSEQKAISEIQNSYIDANVPNNNKFDAFLKRDLEKHFFGTYGEVTVKSEFLRDGPTQSGVAYPKYYLWIKIYKDDKLVNEGAVRVEAIEKKRFEITDFVNSEEIKNNSKDIKIVFPRQVCEKIKSRFK